MTLSQKPRLDELERQIREQEAAFDEVKEQEKKPPGVTNPAFSGADEEPSGFWNRRRVTLVVWLILLGVLIAVVSNRLRGGVKLSNDSDLEMTSILLDSPLVQILGAPEGPFLLVEALGPNRIQLASPQNKMIEFVLVGLRGEPYPNATPVPGSTDIPEPAADPAEIRAYQERMIEEYCGKKQFWILRLSSGSGYLLRPNSIDSGVSHGSAELINASLIRKGYAMLDFIDPNLAFSDRMAECQRTALEEYDNRSAGGDSLWYHFPLAFPRAKLPPSAPFP